MQTITVIAPGGEGTANSAKTIATPQTAVAKTRATKTPRRASPLTEDKLLKAKEPPRYRYFPRLMPGGGVRWGPSTSANSPTRSPWRLNPGQHLESFLRSFLEHFPDLGEKFRTAAGIEIFRIRTKHVELPLSSSISGEVTGYS